MLVKTAIIQNGTREKWTLNFNKFMTEDEVKRVVKRMSAVDGSSYKLIKIIKIKELD